VRRIWITNNLKGQKILSKIVNTSVRRDRTTCHQSRLLETSLVPTIVIPWSSKQFFTELPTTAQRIRVCRQHSADYTTRLLTKILHGSRINISFQSAIEEICDVECTDYIGPILTASTVMQYVTDSKFLHVTPRANKSFKCSFRR
jgi:hypothetical protein